MNWSLTHGLINRMCKGIRAVILAAQADEPPRFSKLIELACKVHYIKDLGAQHLIVAGACAGIIRHGSYYASTAEICEGTHTWKRVTKSYGVPRATINMVYQHAAAELDVAVAWIEEVVCQMGKNCRRMINGKKTQLIFFDPTNPPAPKVTRIGSDTISELSDGSDAWQSFPLVPPQWCIGPCIWKHPPVTLLRKQLVKSFDDIPYMGKVVWYGLVSPIGSRDEVFSYQVVYDDDDTEDLDVKELMQYLVV